MSHAFRTISNRSDICVFFEESGMSVKASVRSGEERERAGEKNSPLFLQNTFHLSKR